MIANGYERNEGNPRRRRAVLELPKKNLGLTNLANVQVAEDANKQKYIFIDPNCATSGPGPGGVAASLKGGLHLRPGFNNINLN